MTAGAHLKSGGWQSTHAAGTALRGRALGIYGHGGIDYHLRTS